jgi:beta-glucanase (GH16 family)
LSITIDPNNPTANATLTFDDEFNSLNLWNGTSGTWDTNYWYNVSGDPKAVNSLPSNGEQEWYIDANDPRTKGVTPWTDSNGVMTIKASPTPGGIASAVNNYSYISGELNTHNSFSQQYGLFEMHAKLPAGQGFWPAFWMLPENGQWPPELDIMENLGQDTNSVYTTVHSNTISGGYTAQKDAIADTTGYHTYAVDWEPDYVTWYLDGKAVDKAPTPSDMNLPMYMELNLAVGGYWPGSPNGSTNFANGMQVDWVKAYQSNAELAAGFKPTGSAAYYGVGSGGSPSGATAGGTPAPTQGTIASSPTSASHAYMQNGKSDILIQNTSGALAVGEVGSDGKEGYAHIGAVGSEWKFAGSGAFSADGHDQFLMQNSSGAVAVGELQNGKAVYSTVSSLGSEWNIASTGNYTGDGHDQYLVKNANGSMDVGEVSNGHTTYTKVGQVGSEWSVKESGDFLGNGHDQYLMQNSKGTVAVGDVQGGQSHYTTVAALGSEWTFEGAGNFLGDGKSQFVVENTKGAVALGEVGSDGKVHYTDVAALGAEWKFKGAGDFLGQGHDQIAMENSSGHVVVADVQNGHLHYTAVSSLGSEWSFHM